MIHRMEKKVSTQSQQQVQRPRDRSVLGKLQKQINPCGKTINKKGKEEAEDEIREGGKV